MPKLVNHWLLNGIRPVIFDDWCDWSILETHFDWFSNLINKLVTGCFLLWLECEFLWCCFSRLRSRFSFLYWFQLCSLSISWRLLKFLRFLNLLYWLCLFFSFYLELNFLCLFLSQIGCIDCEHWLELFSQFTRGNIFARNGIHQDFWFFGFCLIQFWSIQWRFTAHCTFKYDWLLNLSLFNWLCFNINGLYLEYFFRRQNQTLSYIRADFKISLLYCIFSNIFLIITAAFLFHFHFLLHKFVSCSKNWHQWFILLWFSISLYTF